MMTRIKISFSIAWLACGVSCQESSKSTLSTRGAVFVGDTSDFDIKSPVGSSREASPLISWNRPAVGATYRVKIGATPDCEKPIFQASTGTVNISKVTPALAEGSYFTCVEATLSDGVVATPKNDGAPFTIDLTGPGKFEITGPSIAIDSRAVVIGWSDPGEPATFEIAIDSDADCKPPFVQSYSGVKVFSQPIAAISPGVYQACVTATDMVGNKSQAANNPFKFVALDQSAVGGSFRGFQVTGPKARILDAKPSVTWDGAQGNTVYSVKVAEDPRCESPVYSNDKITGLAVSLDRDLVANKAYYVCLAAKDEKGQITPAVNSPYTFVVDTTPPEAFTISGPLSPTDQIKPQVSWTPSVDAVSYDLVVDTDVACAPPHVQAHRNLTTTAVELTTLTTGSTYKICLIARDMAGNTRSATNSPYLLNVVAPGTGDINPIGNFAIIGPGSAVATARPTIRWQYASFALSYDVKVATDYVCGGTAVFSANDVTSLSANVNVDLAVGTTYYACVTAKDGSGHTREAYNMPYPIGVDTVGPSAFTITGPAGTVATSSPQVNWTNPGDAATFQVIIDTESTCSVPYVQTFSGISGLSQIVSSLADGAYFVCVKAYDAAGNMTNATNSGSGSSFTVSAQAMVLNPLGNFSISGPIGATNNTTPTVSWSASSGATKYDLTVASDFTCTTPITGGTFSNLAALSKNLTSALTAGTGYYLCVTAKDDAGNIKVAANQPVYFVVDTTGPGAFSITGPASPIAVSTPQANWGSSMDAVSYKVVIDTESSCTVPYVQSYSKVQSTSQALSLLGDGTYYICAEATDAAGNVTAATNNGYSFVVATTLIVNPVGSFNITGPKANINTIRPTISWNPAAAATKYDLVIGTDVSCNNAVVTQSNLTTLSHALTQDLTSGMSYYVCITAKDNSGNTRVATNQPYGITVDTTGPGAVTITGPASPVKVSAPQVSWTPVNDAAAYNLVVDSEASCSVPYVQSYSNITATSQNLSELTDGTYYVCVKSIDAAGNSTVASNDQYSFTVSLGGTVANPVGTFNITAPRPIVGSTTPTVTWTAASGATKYDIKYGTSVDCSSTLGTNVTDISKAFASALVANTTYYICVTAKDDANNMRLASNQPYMFRIDQTAPQAFSITGPASPVNVATPQVSWTASADASTYSVFIDTESTCAAPVVQTYSGVTGTSQNISALANGDYYACVKGYDEAGNVTSATGSPLTFTVNVPTSGGSGGGGSGGGSSSTPVLGAFSITSPTSEVYALRPTLSWTASSAATKYDVVVATDLACATPVTGMRFDNVAALSQALSADLTAGTNYFLCVTAKDNTTNVRVASNSPYPFTIDRTPPAAFSITGPASPTTVRTPQVSWTTSLGAASYSLKIASSSACSAPFVQQYDLSGISAHTLDTLAAGTFYVCLSAQDLAGNTVTATGSPYTLTINDPSPPQNTALGTFSITAPAAKVSSLTPVISWSASTGATKYDVILASDLACTTSVATFNNVSALSQALSTSLSASSTYYLCVTAKDASGNSRVANNSPYSFTVDQTPPGSFAITGPVTPTTSSSPQVIWTAADDAASYVLQVATSSACTAPFVQQYNLGQTVSQTLSALVTGTYYLCLKAFDAAGNSTTATGSPYTLVITGTSAGDGLGAFNITAPASTINTLLPTITWQTSSAATKYDVVVSAVATCATSVASATNVVGTSHTISTPLTSGSIYYVCVTAKNEDGLTRRASNNPVVVTVDTTPPAAFNITAPTSDSSSPTPTITWASATGAATYELVIDTEATCALPNVQYVTGITDTFSTITTALAEGSYFVCVTALDDSGNSRAATNNGFGLVVDSTPPGTFAITAPVSGLTTPLPTMTWDAAPGATVYDVAVASSSTCSAPYVASVNNRASTSWTVASSLAAGAYFVCVSAKDGAGNVRTASNQGVATFTVDAVLPGTFAITGPAAQLANNRTPSITWGAATDAATYEVFLDDESTCATPRLQTYTVTAPATTRALTTLTDGTYFACVTAIDAAGNRSTATNSPYSFTVDDSAPAVPAAPTDGAFSTTATSVTFNWVAVSDVGPAGLNAYFLRVGTTAGGSDTFYGKVGTTLTRTFTGLIAGSTYYASVMAVDNYGNTSAWSTASDGILIDQVAPPALATFATLTAIGNVYPIGTVNLTWTYPATTTDYDRIELRRAATSAPADCTSGTLVKTIRIFTLTSLLDDTNSPGTTFGYRACIYDVAGNVTSSNTLTVAASNQQMVFQTAQSFTGNLKEKFDNQDFFSGLEGADRRCQYWASLNGRGNAVWRALLSSSAQTAGTRMEISGTVINWSGTSVATSEADFLDNTMAAAIQLNGGTGATLGSYTGILGDGSGGATVNHCSDWSSASASFNGTVGSIPTGTATILNASTVTCDLSRPILCVSHTLEPIKRFVADRSDASGNVALTVELLNNVASSRINALQIRRVSGSTPPDTSCAGSSDVVVKSWTAAEVNAATTLTVTDNTGTSGTYSYRACLLNNSGGVLYSQSATTGAVFGQHTVFVTSAAYPMMSAAPTYQPLDLFQADQACQARATAANLPGYWMAIMSSQDANASQRLTVSGPVYNNGPGRDPVATSSADLWSGTIRNIVGFDETGASTGTALYWTGTQSNGAVDTGGYCNHWHTPTSSFYANLGRGDQTNASWVYNTTGSCAESYRLLCISQSAPDLVRSFDVAEATSGAHGNVVVTVSFNSDAVMANYSSVKVFRTMGLTAPAACAVSGGVVEAANITSFSSTSTTVDSPGYGAWSYRMCVYNAAGTKIYSVPSRTVWGRGSHRMFVSNSTIAPSTMGGVVGADNFCQVQADRAGHRGTWRAMLATNAVSPSAPGRMGFLGDLYNLNNQKMATTSTSFWATSLLAPPMYDEFGTSMGGTAVQTSFDWGGNLVSAGYTCSEWTLTSGTIGFGVANSTSSTWAYNSTTSCGSRPLYCYNHVQPATLTAADGDDPNQIVVTVTPNPSLLSGDYTSMQLRRLAGVNFPSGACNNGTVVATLNAPFEETYVYDSGLTAGFYSYRLCAYSGATLKSSTAVVKMAPTPAHNKAILMVGGLTFTTGQIAYNSFTGLLAADALCQASATQGGLAGNNWFALLSTSTINAKDRFPLTGDVHNTNNEAIVNASSPNLWDGGSNAAAVSYSEHILYPPNLTSNVWTGTNSTGNFVASNSCSDWTSTTGNAQYGSSSSAAVGWLNTSSSACTGRMYLYCIRPR
jgi:hypothetical protein